MGEPQPDRILAGDLSTMSLQATLKMLTLSGKNGILSVSAQPPRAQIQDNALTASVHIFLRNGHLVNLDSSSPPYYPVLEMFRLLQRIDSQQLQRFQTIADIQDLTRLLNVLVQERIITEQEFRQRHEFAVIQQIAQCLRWDKGSFSFQAQNRQDSPNDKRMELNIDNVLLEALRMIDEWSKLDQPVSRYATPRWMTKYQIPPQVIQALSDDEKGVLLLANGSIPVYAMAYALLISEVRVAVALERLVQVNLVEIVDDGEIRKIEQKLETILSVAHNELPAAGRQKPDVRVTNLISALGKVLNLLIAHHLEFARALQMSQRITDTQRKEYADQVFGAILSEVRQQQIEMLGINLQNGQIDLTELKQLHRDIKGEALYQYYLDAARGLRIVLHRAFALIVQDEIGSNRLNNRVQQQWNQIMNQVDTELTSMTPA